LDAAAGLARESAGVGFRKKVKEERGEAASSDGF
jgi:hypothetical protein